MVEGLSGKDVITGRSLAWWERSLGIVCGALDVVVIAKVGSVAIQEVRAVSIATKLEIMTGRASAAVLEALGRKFVRIIGTIADSGIVNRVKEIRGL